MHVPFNSAQEKNQNTLHLICTAIALLLFLPGTQQSSRVDALSTAAKYWFFPRINIAYVTLGVHAPKQCIAYSILLPAEIAPKIKWHDTVVHQNAAPTFLWIQMGEYSVENHGVSSSELV